MLFTKIINRIKQKGQFIKSIFRKGSQSNLWPALVAFPLAAQCNYRCNFCEINGVLAKLKEQGKEYQPNKLTLEQIQKFNVLLPNANTIDFGGLTALGEPLINPSFQDIITHLRSFNKQASICITTNGRLLSKNISDFLIQAAPLNLTFSIHSVTENVYEKVMAKGFNSIVDNVTYFCKRKNEMRSPGTTIMNFGIGKFNYFEAETAVRFAKERGIDYLNIYPYYKSPNSFGEDVSLYSDPDLANSALSRAYEVAKAIGQKMIPDCPAYIVQRKPELSSMSPAYRGGCQQPFTQFILKSDPFHINKTGFCVCNRIVPFLVDMDSRITERDILWAWNHPVIQKMRNPQDDLPEICAFCKNPNTSYLRSLDQEEYKRRRDLAVKNDLSRFQKFKYSPNRSIELLAENIFSI